jgi:hypothetical protein
MNQLKYVGIVGQARIQTSKGKAVKIDNTLNLSPRALSGRQVII